MYLLDTNVVSELRRSRPHGAVLAWLKAMKSSDLNVSAISIGELQSGVEITREQNPAKAAEIEAWIDKVLETFTVIDAGSDIFRRWARIRHKRSQAVAQDALIAATAEVHGLIVVTRNVRDFESLGARTLNPFNYGG